MSGFLHLSSGLAPHRLHASPFSFNKGLLLAHVPENCPSFLINIFIAIPAKAMANRQIERRSNCQFILRRYLYYFSKCSHYTNFIVSYCKYLIL